MLSYWVVGARLLGLSRADLRRLARQPDRTVHRPWNAGPVGFLGRTRDQLGCGGAANG